MCSQRKPMRCAPGSRLRCRASTSTPTLSLTLTLPLPLTLTLTGQAEALRTGIATAMQGFDITTYRPVLKAAGFLMRDPRARERQKPGQKGARKKFAWVKR